MDSILDGSIVSNTRMDRGEQYPLLNWTSWWMHILLFYKCMLPVHCHGALHVVIDQNNFPPNNAQNIHMRMDVSRVYVRVCLCVCVIDCAHCTRWCSIKTQSSPIRNNFINLKCLHHILRWQYHFTVPLNDSAPENVWQLFKNNILICCSIVNWYITWILSAERIRRCDRIRNFPVCGSDVCVVCEQGNQRKFCLIPVKWYAESCMHNSCSRRLLFAATMDNFRVAKVCRCRTSCTPQPIPCGARTLRFTLHF